MSGLLDQFAQRSGRLSDDFSAYSAGDINGAQVALRTAGETAGGVGDAAFAAVSAAVPDAVKTVIQKTGIPAYIVTGLSEVARGAAGTPAGKAALAWAKKNPETTRDLMMAANVGSLLPGSAVSKAGKGMLSYGKEATKGGSLANMSNYIKNWYGPTDSPIPLKAGAVVGKVAGRTPEEAGIGLLKAGGLLETGLKGAKDTAQHLLSPSSRAKYGELGITTPAQNIIKGHLGNQANDSRAISKAVSQVHYTSGHIPEQAGRVGKIAPTAKEVLNRSFLSDYFENKPGSIQSELNKHSVKVDVGNATRGSSLKHDSKAWKDMPDLPANPADSRFVEKYLNNVMEFDKVVVKTPTNIQTGGHFNDVVHKNPANSALKNILGLKKLGAYNKADNTINLQKLAEGLKTKVDKNGLGRGSKANDTWRVIDDSPEGIAANGLWLRGSKGGSAVTEGGVGWLMKIEPDGTTTSFMFDKHDFLEKLPGAREYAKSVLPEGLVAITPAMKSNILKKGRTHFKQTKSKKGTEDTMEGVLQNYVDAKASKRNVQGETLRNVGAGLQIGGLLGASEN